MIILGISCGRDASAAILQDGVLLSHVIRERLTRTRHARGICRRTIEAALDAAHLSPFDIDACAIALSADESPVFIDPDYFSFAPSPDQTANNVNHPNGHAVLHVQLNGRPIDGTHIHAHAAHAASSFYSSGFRHAAILTHDGGAGDNSGFLWYGSGSTLQMQRPHGLALAALYDRAAQRCGLGRNSAGKLMGLAGYGAPLYLRPDLVGPKEIWHRVLGVSDEADVIDAVLQDMLRIAEDRGDRISHLTGAPIPLPDPTAANLASSVQDLFARTLLQTAQDMLQTVQDSGIPCDGLCLGGGAALNCPSNSLLAARSGFERVFIEPHCDNTGLSIGAATSLWHAIMGNPLGPDYATSSSYAMTGPDHHAPFTVPPSLCAEDGLDAPVRAAQDLAQGKIIGWFWGRSESGPRALGHRSILADPRRAEHSVRANSIKHREEWRPLAPSCLLSDFSAWFKGPSPSPFMLFTHQVLEEKRALIPAVVHKDGSARVQTVIPGDGPYFDLITAFKEITGIPLVLNTSFNGPNEPIVETPEDAINFFMTSELDVLYLNGTRITRPCS